MVYVLKPIQLAIWHDKGAYKWNSTGIKGLASAFVLEDQSNEDSIFNREIHVNTLWDTLTETTRISTCNSAYWTKGQINCPVLVLVFQSQ